MSRRRIIRTRTGCFVAFAAAIVSALLYSASAQADSEPVSASSGEGHDFAADAKLIYRVVICGSDEPLPSTTDQRAVARHCREQGRRIAKFRKKYVVRAQPFFSKLRPSGLPDRVVYPFGGGDLLSAIPGQLTFFLMALAVHDYEPVSLRFFRIENDGSLHYYGESEISRLDSTLAQRKSKRWVDTDYSVAFSNMELGFRKRGQPNAPVRIHRHIAANLDDDHFAASSLRAHLMKKGKVAAMTKAASYLLWRRSFSAIRTYLLDHMAFMISDSTGIPPRFARAAGFVQRTYGAFEGALLDSSRKSRYNQELVDLWQAQPKRRLRFRYGYVDSANNFHLLVTSPRRPRPQ